MARKKAVPKPPRRKPGTGTIRFKKGRDLPWEAAFPLGHGRHRYDYFQSRKEADAHLNRLVEEARSKELPRNVTGGSQRVDDFFVKWLGLKEPHIKPKTFSNYQYLLELACIEIGKHRLDEVTREMAEAMLVFFQKRGFKNLSQMKTVCKEAFDYAEEEGYIRRNPFDKARVPPVERRKAIALTETQRAAYLAQYADHPLECLFHLYARVGLRRGEGEGLRWEDVDWDEGTITIVQQYTDVDGVTTESTPKSKRSRRTIPIPPDLLDALRMHRERQREHIAKAINWKEHGLVFPSEVGTPLRPRNINRLHDKMVARANVPDVTVHDLRHTANYLLERQGAPESARMALLGHSAATMTKHYSDHADIEAMREMYHKTERGNERGRKD